MTITKELLIDSGIISMNIIKDVLNINCILIKSEKDTLLFNYTGKESFIENDKITLNIMHKGTSTIPETSKIELLVMEAGQDYIQASIIKTDDFFSTFLKKLSFLEYQDEKYGRRKEPRLVVGKNNFEAFGLTSVEQNLFSESARIIQPCAILDVSFHGICIITRFENPAFKNIENFNIHLAFTNPVQTVILMAHKVHSKLKSTEENNVFATISCQLLEPINYVWKERVIKLLEMNQD